MPSKAIEQQLLSIPAVKKAGLLSFEPACQGTINKTYQVETTLGRWAVRLNQNDMPGINRQREIDILTLIQGQDIGPDLIAHDVEKQCLITRWVEGDAWTTDDLANPDLLQRLKVKLGRLHQIHYNNKATYLMARIIEYILFFADASESLKKAISESVKALNQTGFWQKQNRLLHFDVHPYNIIGHENPIIIDWEYAGSGHPLLEWLIIQHYAEKDISEQIPRFNMPEEHKEASRLIDLLMELWQS